MIKNKREQVELYIPLIDGSRGGAIRPWPHHGFREGPCPLLRLQKESLKVSGSWRSASFFLLTSVAIILKI